MSTYTRILSLHKIWFFLKNFAETDCEIRKEKRKRLTNHPGNMYTVYTVNIPVCLCSSFLAICLHVSCPVHSAYSTCVNCVHTICASVLSWYIPGICTSLASEHHSICTSLASVNPFSSVHPRHLYIPGVCTFLASVHPWRLYIPGICTSLGICTFLAYIPSKIYCICS